MNNNAFKDPAAERTLIATILRHGKDALLDAQTYVKATDFSLPVNRALFTCLESLGEDSLCEQFDPESIRLKSKVLGLDNYITGKKESEYIDLLPESNVSTQNLPMFALKVKKHSIIRDLYQRYQDAQNYLGTLNGDEDLSEILRNAESTVMDYISGKDNANGLSDICDDIVDQILAKIDNDPIDQVGLPTGFHKYDKAIGGGMRRGAIAMIGARSKVGKGFVAMNIARNITRRNIPVLYLDTEMTKNVQQSRLICIDADCPLELYETGRFKFKSDLKERVLASGHELNTLPFQYQEIAGMNHTEALAIARRWLTRTVGFNENGEANDCLIIYDYVKLTSAVQIATNMAEHAAVGFLMTDLNSFAVRHKVPILAFAQLNRDGINENDGSVIALSDRILWLCSSMSFLKNKTEDDENLQCGFEYGNKKLSILDTRYGAGLFNENDYINISASLRPRISELEATGKMEEGLLFSEVTGKC